MFASPGARRRARTGLGVGGRGGRRALRRRTCRGGGRCAGRLRLLRRRGATRAVAVVLRGLRRDRRAVRVAGRRRHFDDLRFFEHARLRLRVGLARRGVRRRGLRGLRHRLARRLALQRTVRIVLRLARAGIGRRGRRHLRDERRRRTGDIQRHHYRDRKADDQAQHDAEKSPPGLFRLLCCAAWFCHRMNHLQKESWNGRRL